MKKLTLVFIISLIVSFTCKISLLAVSGAQFLKIDPSARSYAMGKTQMVNSLGVESINSNPAQLSQMDRKFQMSSAFSTLMDGGQYGYIGMAINRSLKKKRIIDAIGFSYGYVSVGGFVGTDELGNTTGDFESKDQVMSLALNGSVNQSLRLGFTGKVVKSNIAGYQSGSLMAADIGMSYRFDMFNRGIELGASVTNIGQGIKYINETDSLPTAFNLGFRNVGSSLHLVLGASHWINDSLLETSAGLEYELGMISLRAGLKGEAGGSENLAAKSADQMTKMMQNFTTGIGFKIGGLKIDYSLGQQSAEMGWNHRGSLTLEWGGSKINNTYESLPQRKFSYDQPASGAEQKKSYSAPARNNKPYKIPAKK